jgi:predicted ester cyclase
MIKRLMTCTLAFLLALATAMSLSGPGTQSASTLEQRIQKANDELFNKGNLEMVHEVFAPNYVIHSTDGDVEGGPDIIKGFVTDLRAAFPDLRVEIEVLVEEGDRVAWQRTHRGTFKADFRGIAATGRAMVWRDIVVTYYKDDKIAEEWGVSQFVERAKQP